MGIAGRGTLAPDRPLDRHAAGEWARRSDLPLRARRPPDRRRADPGGRDRHRRGDAGRVARGRDGGRGDTKPLGCGFRRSRHRVRRAVRRGAADGAGIRRSARRLGATLRRDASVQRHLRPAGISGAHRVRARRLWRAHPLRAHGAGALAAGGHGRRYGRRAHGGRGDQRATGGLVRLRHGDGPGGLCRLAHARGARVGGDRGALGDARRGGGRGVCAARVSDALRLVQLPALCRGARDRAPHPRRVRARGVRVRVRDGVLRDDAGELWLVGADEFTGRSQPDRDARAMGGRGRDGAVRRHVGGGDLPRRAARAAGALGAWAAPAWALARSWRDRHGAHLRLRARQLSVLAGVLARRRTLSGSDALGGARAAGRAADDDHCAHAVRSHLVRAVRAARAGGGVPGDGDRRDRGVLTAGRLGCRELVAAAARSCGGRGGPRCRRPSRTCGGCWTSGLWCAGERAKARGTMLSRPLPSPPHPLRAPSLR